MSPLLERRSQPPTLRAARSSQQQATRLVPARLVAAKLRARRATSSLRHAELAYAHSCWSPRFLFDAVIVI